jgi:hypothetical protein
MFTKAERSSFPYWWAHWCAYQMTALNCRSWKFKYLFHDCEKPWLRIFLPYPKVQKLHRAYNKHHPEWLEHKLEEMINKYEGIGSYDVFKFLNKFDYEGAIIDWECCHFTKVEEPLDAHDEYKRLLNHDNFSKKYPCITKYCYNEFSKRLMDAIKKLGLENEY